MTVTSNIALDLRRPDSTRNCVYAKTGDSRSVEAALYDGGEPWAAPSGATVVIRFCKPDKTGGIYDTLPSGATAYTIATDQDTGGTVVTATLAPQMLTCPGLVVADMVIISGSDTVATFSWRVDVQWSPMDGVDTTSQDYYNYQTLAQINRGIAAAQAAADAAVKTVNGKAPDSNGNVNVTPGSSGVSSINGQRGALTLPICGSAICGTSAGVAAKVAVLSSQNFTPVEGAILGVRFTATNTAANPTLQCASFTGPIADPTGELVAPGKITAGFHLFFRGPTAWILIGSAPDDDFLPLSGGVMTGPLQGTIASMDQLVARSRLVLDDMGYGKIYAKNVSDEGDPAIDLSDREAPGGNPVRVTGVKTPVQDNDAATKSYVDAKIGSGSAGKDGGYYQPSVDGAGNLTWTASKSGMPAVDSANIRGPQGPKGDTGNPGPQGPQGPAGTGLPTPTTQQAGMVPAASGSSYALSPITPLFNCASAASSTTKVLSGDYALPENGLFAVMFAQSNTASAPVLSFGGKTYTILLPHMEQTFAPQNLVSGVHLFMVFNGSYAALMNPNWTSNGQAAAIAEGLTE